MERKRIIMETIIFVIGFVLQMVCRDEDYGYEE